MEERMTCIACENVGFYCSDGFYYCNQCGSQAEGLAETGVADEDFMDIASAKFNRRSVRTVKTESFTQESQLFTKPRNTNSQFDDVDYGKPAVPRDFGVLRLNSDDYSSEIRIRYVMGIQLMIQYQCEALVEKFQVSPLICGLSGVIWMRYVAVSRVFDKDWADNTIAESERQGEESEKIKHSRYRTEPHNMHGERAVMIWLRSLQKEIPISSSLAVSFLACHVAREAILSTDIWKWTLDGKLPYLNAFVKIKDDFSCPSSACPLSPNVMFRPLRVLRPMALESRAGFVAQCIGLELPPVNFYAIVCRYLKQLSLSKEKILPLACRIYEWSMSPDLWLSANPHKISTRVCVMSILIVTIRVLYNINGFGKWESKLSSIRQLRKRNTDVKECSRSSSTEFNPDKLKISTSKIRKRNEAGTRYSDSDPNPKIKQPVETQTKGTKTNGGLSHLQDSELDTADLLLKLETTYEDIVEEHEYLHDLPTYLKFCKDVVFAESTRSLQPNEADQKLPEDTLIEELWNYYENQEEKKTNVGCSGGLSQNRSMENERLSTDAMRNAMHGVDCSVKKSPDVGDVCSSGLQDDQTLQSSDRVLGRMKLNMEDNRFCYIPPRVNPKRFDYLHYARKNDEGTREYVAHADYYILLRACARVVEVDVRYMHAAVLKLEKRLAWMENQVDHNLQSWTQKSSPSRDDAEEETMDLDDSLDFSNFKFVI